MKTSGSSDPFSSLRYADGVAPNGKKGNKQVSFNLLQ